MKRDANDIARTSGLDALRGEFDRSCIDAHASAAMGQRERHSTEALEAGRGQDILDRRAPMDSAKFFVKARYTAGDLLTLRHHRGEFFEWNGSVYRRADAAAIKAEVYQFLYRALQVKTDGTTEPFRPNRDKVKNLLDALEAVTILPSSVTAPTWLAESGSNLSPAECVAVANGILHLPTRTLHRPTPAFFATNALPVRFDEKVAAPAAWLNFLGALWPQDNEAIETLQEMFGYLLTADTRQQKAFLIVGPKRSGKGTIARVLTAMLGPDSVAAPSVSSISTNFGLAPLIGKPLAIIPDARVGGRSDQQVIAERLLTISGEDGISIDRKHLPAWTGRLPTRFLVLANELPRLADASGALASRFIVLTMAQSFFGREDPGLFDRLSTELPGILRWSIEGWHRLQSRGYFRQPSSSWDAADELETLGSPVLAFIKDCCEIGPGQEVSTKDLYEAWREWCLAHGRQDPGTITMLGRDLRAAVPVLRVVQSRTQGGRERRYQGISLR